MRKSFFIAAICVVAFQACEKRLIVEDAEYNDGFSENEIHCLVTAGLPSDQSSAETRVALEGDYPSAPIVAKWQGSSIDYQDKFAILGYDSDGNIAHVTDATRIIDETEDSATGTFEFTIDKDYWIDDLEYKSFYPFFPSRDYDTCYYTGSDDDKDNWVYKFTEQTGHFDDLTNNLFMTGSELNIDDPDVNFQYGVAILRLSNLSIPGLEGQTVSGIKVRSNAISDAVSYRYSFSDYYAAGNEINLNGTFCVGANGLIEENIYLVFYPSSELLQYLSISLESNGKVYSYSYSGTLSSFITGKVYSLNGAELTYRDTSPDYNWYLYPVGEDHYLISNAKEFLGFQRIVNGDETALSIVGIEEADKFESKTIDLHANATIDLSYVLNPGESWIPINGFKGTLNGNGATVSNLYIDGAFHYLGARIGLFASLENATITSLNLTGKININGCYNGYIGGLVAYSVESLLINCTTEMVMSHSGGYSNTIGGLVGSMVRNSIPTHSNIIGCLDKSTITISTQSRDWDYVGGVIGDSAGSNTTILACVHLDNPIMANQYTRVGGIVGTEALYSYANISACFNSGDVNPSLSAYGGQIHGGSANTTPISSLQISSCYYSGGGQAYCGVAIRSGGGNVDAGTKRVKTIEEMQEACDDMNAVIEEWNSNNPSTLCTRKYYVEQGFIVFR